MPLHETLVNRRKELGLSQAQLAAIARVHKQTVARVERRKKVIKEIATLCAFADGLQLDIRDLILPACQALHEGEAS